MLLYTVRKHIKFIGIFLIAIFLGGCKNSFKQNFRDFRAHYNTFYNAKKSFETGLEKNDSQLRDYNPYIPIRVHQAPVNAGNQDFQQSIDKGADVIRKHSTSKWVDDAIELIGKSYYYRQEFFSADQKFQELYDATTDARLKQNSVYWRGRTYLDLELHQEGVNFITEQLAIFEGTWDKKIEAEVRAVLSQHHIQLQNYNEAEEQLALSIDNLTTNPHKARGYFLYGQILEHNGKLEEASSAYSNVRKFYEDYDLFFLAQVKNGQLARQLGRWDTSYSTFLTMVRDDKNFEKKTELDYELARTEQQAGNFASAEEIYFSILGNELDNPTKVTIAKSYYGLGEINSEYYNDFTLAAAYFDSAAQQQIPAELLPEDFIPDELASSFGQYAELTQSLHLSDSLLWLGSLSKNSLDSVVLELKKKRRDEIIQELREQEARRNTLVNVSAPRGPVQAGSNQRNGFLNYKSPVLISDARTQFRAVWGDRPLADNWRRAAAIRVSNSDSSETAQNGQNGSSLISSINLSDIQIDLSRVPVTEEQKMGIKMSIAEELYQLGNLFFLSLDMPDSANFYFSKVIDEHPESSAAPVATYSLSELYASNDEPNQAIETAIDLIQKYPGTIYAQRLQNRYQLGTQNISTNTVNSDSLKLEYQSLKNSLSEPKEKAILLRDFALNNTTHISAPAALYESALFYIEAAKDSAYSSNITILNEKLISFQEQEKSLSLRKDSARIALNDTTISEQETSYWQSVLDLPEIAHNLNYKNLYRGAYWDSARVTLNRFSDMFPETPFSGKVEALKTELDISSIESLEEEPDLPEGTSFYGCEESNLQPKVRGGMNEFLSNVSDEGITLDRPLTYTFWISETGDILSYRNTEGLSQIYSSFEEVIDDYLLFEVTQLEGTPIAVRCNITFSSTK